MVEISGATIPEDKFNTGDPRIFMGNVAAFMKWIEGPPRTESPLEFLVVMNDILLGVARAGLFLTGGAGSDENSLLERFRVTNNESLELQSKLDNFLGPLVEHAKKHHGKFEPYTTTLHMLTNDLVETYEDLASGNRIWWSGQAEAKEEALWYWNFQKWHWHEHLYRALLGTCLVRFSVADDGICDEPIFESHP